MKSAPTINGGTVSGPEISNVPIYQSKFEKLDKTNCVYGRIPIPGTSSTNYKYLGNFDTYDKCAASPSIDSNAKAITHHGANSGGFSHQCFSIDDTNTRVLNQNDTTCGIRLFSSFFKLEDAAGIKQGKYNNISFNTFGLNSNLNNWTITIILSAMYTSSKWQGIIGNIDTYKTIYKN